MKCLILDDSNVTLFVTQNILETLNFDVLSAKNLDEAYNHIDNQDLDLIITDIHLERESGVDLIREVKTHINKDIPIIVLTGVEDKQQKEDILKMGIDDYLLKPTTIDKIRVSLDKISTAK